MRIILTLIGITSLLLPLPAQQVGDPWRYCDTCIVHYPVVLPTVAIALNPFYLSSGTTGRTTATLSDYRDFNIYYRYNPTTRSGALTGWNADTSIWFNGSFLLDTVRIIDPVQVENINNPGTYTVDSVCCYYRLLPDNQWETRHHAPSGSMFHTTQSWADGVKHGYWKQMQDSIILLEGNYISGRHVGKWIKPGDNNRFVEEYDSTGRINYSGSIRMYNDSVFYEEWYSPDSAQVLLETDTGALRIVMRQSVMQYYYPGGKLHVMAVYYSGKSVTGKSITFCDSLLARYEDGNLKQTVIRKRELNEVCEYYPGGALKSKGLFYEWHRDSVEHPRGTHFYWNQEGKLIETKEYDKRGNLLKTTKL
jgi:antitoxin component YwqK of YwqJK toxin-antitoxin module